MVIKALFELLIRDYWQNIYDQKTTSLEALKGEAHWFDALIHFKNYAYERNISGAAAAYKEVADEVLAPLKKRVRWGRDLERTIWHDFRENCAQRGIKPNKTVNPLRPSRDAKVNLVTFVWNIRKESNQTVAEWAFKMLLDGKIEEAHDRLMNVWGIRTKIASFYLRDIFWLGNNLNPERDSKCTDYYLIQPIDIWPERASRALGNNNHSKIAIAKFINSFEEDIGLPPGGCNIGFWMLGSNYIEDEDQFDDVIKGIAHKCRKSVERTLAVAKRFKEFYGEFGRLLLEI
jgi:hypothetical protein